MLAVRALSHLLSPDQPFAQNEALLDALNIDRSNYDRSSPDAYMISMLTDKNLIARDVALQSLYRMDFPPMPKNGMIVARPYKDAVITIATLSEPVKNALLKIAAEDDYFIFGLRPNPDPNIFGAESYYFSAPFRDQAIKILNANGVDIRLDENKLIYDGLAWRGEVYLANKTYDERRSAILNLRRLDPTHPAIVYAQQQLEKIAGGEALKKSAFSRSTNPYWAAWNDIPELRDFFKFLAEATPEMWKKALAENSQETLATTAAETPESSTEQTTPPPTASPEPQEPESAATATEPAEIPSSFPLPAWLVSLAIVFLAGIGYIVYRRK